MEESDFYERGIDVAHRVVGIAEGLGADDVAAIYSDSTGRQVRFSDNRVDVAKTWLSRSVSLCIGKENRITIVSTDDLRPSELEKFVEVAMSRLGHLPPRPIYAPLPDGPFDYPVIPDLYDPSLEEAQEELVDAAKVAVDAAMGEGSNRAAGAVRSNAGSSCLVTTGDVEVCRRASFTYLEIRAFADGEATGHGATCSRRLDGIDPKAAGENAGRDAVLARNVVRAQPGRYDTIFGRSALGNLVGIFGAMASAFHVLMQMTPYVGRLNDSVASKVITLLDDPLAPGGYGSRPHDDEGFPARKNLIVDKGVLKSYLHNRLTAKAFKTRSTASAGWINPRPWNLILEPGDYGEEEMMRELRDGLVVGNATYLRFQNYRTGDFSAVVRDGVFRVKGGEVLGAVRGLRLSDNVMRLLSNAYAASKHSVPIFHWWMETQVPVQTPLIAVRGTGFTAATI